MLPSRPPEDRPPGARRARAGRSLKMPMAALSPSELAQLSGRPADYERPPSPPPSPNTLQQMDGSVAFTLATEYRIRSRFYEGVHTTSSLYGEAEREALAFFDSKRDEVVERSAVRSEQSLKAGQAAQRDVVKNHESTEVIIRTYEKEKVEPVVRKVRPPKVKTKASTRWNLLKISSQLAGTGATFDLDETTGEYTERDAAAENLAKQQERLEVGKKQWGKLRGTVAIGTVLGTAMKDAAMVTRMAAEMSVERRVRHSRSHAEAEGGEDMEPEWNENQRRVLYMIILLTHDPAMSTWVRRNNLMVYIFEAAVAGVLDYDYAPKIEVIAGRRVFVNISQEGRDDVDDLRHYGLLHSVRLQTAQQFSQQAFCPTIRGLSLVESGLSDADRESVHRLLYVGSDGNKGARSDLKELRWHDPTSRFFMINKRHQFSQASSFTEEEVVSYVSSPYIPANLIRGERVQLSDNQHRLPELHGAVSTVRDLSLDEMIVLRDARVLLCEWFPQSSNEMAVLNARLGGEDRVRGGFFTEENDESPCQLVFKGTSGGLTQATPLDSEESSYSNLEAEVFYPTELGVVQVEHIGVHFNEDGFAAYGLHVDGVMNHAADHISIDNLSRVVSDLRADSSTLAGSMLAEQQLQLLQEAYPQDLENREKVIAILVEGISPKASAELYFDSGPMESEVKQVLGEMRSAHDLGEGLDSELLILGSLGLLLSGPNCRRHEPIITAYLSLSARSLFVENLFRVVVAFCANLKDIQSLIDGAESHPDSLESIRKRLTAASSSANGFDQIRGYLVESMRLLEVPASPSAREDMSGAMLHKILRLSTASAKVSARIADLRKVIATANLKIMELRRGAANLSKIKRFRIRAEVQARTEVALDAFLRIGDWTTRLSGLIAVLVGMAAVGMLDSLHGLHLYSALNSTAAPQAALQPPTYYEPIVEMHGGALAIHLGFWLLASIAAFGWVSQHNESLRSVARSVEVLHRKVDIDKLRTFVDTKPKGRVLDQTGARGLRTQRVAWAEPADIAWLGLPPAFELVVDHSGWLTSIATEFSLSCSLLTQDEVRDRLALGLYRAGVFLPSPEWAAEDTRLRKLDAEDERQRRAPKAHRKRVREALKRKRQTEGILAALLAVSSVGAGVLMDS